MDNGLNKRMIKKAKLRNIQTYAFSSREVFLDYIKDKKKILIAINAEKILNEDSRLHKIINKNIAYADGFGAVIALKQKGLDAIKIPGAEFWLNIVDRFHKEMSFFLMGSSQVVIEKTILKLKDEYSGINIVGYRNGYLKNGDNDKLFLEIKRKKPDIVFIAQGSPRQEFLMEQLLKNQPALYMGLGGSFDVYCGLKKRAPKLFLKLNLEWFYRLIKEPTRFKRQLSLIHFYLLFIFRRI